MRHMWVMMAALGLLGLTSVVGCKKKGGRKAVAAGTPVTGTWTEPTSQARWLTLDHDDGVVKVWASGLRLRVSLEVRPGTTWEIGGQRGTVDAKGLGEVTLEQGAALRALAPATLDEVDLGVRVVLTLPKGRSGSFPVPALSFVSQVKNALEAVDKGPVRFGADEADEAAALALDGAFFVDGLTDRQFIGAAPTLAAVDLVALTQRLKESKGKKGCEFQDRSTGKMVTVEINLVDTEVTLWDRRTGKQVEKHVFGPDEECPALTFTRPGESQDSYIPHDAIVAWLTQRVAPAPVAEALPGADGGVGAGAGAGAADAGTAGP